MTEHRPPSGLTLPPQLSTWSAALADVDIPVLAYSRERIRRLAESEDDVDFNLLADIVTNDPLLIVRLLRDGARLRSRHLDGAPQSASEALMLMGSGPFFRSCEHTPVMQEVLADNAQALAGLTTAVARCYRAGRLAQRFVAQRDDVDSVLMSAAALLHGLGEMLLWLEAPDIALQAQAERRFTRGFGHERELKVEGLSLTELGLDLQKTWQLPRRLIELGDAAHNRTNTARVVDLAVRIAWFDRCDWGDPRFARLLSEARELLRMGGEQTRRFLEGLT